MMYGSTNINSNKHSDCLQYLVSAHHSVRTIRCVKSYCILLVKGSCDFNVNIEPLHFRPKSYIIGICVYFVGKTE